MGVFFERRPWAGTEEINVREIRNQNELETITKREHFQYRGLGLVF